MAVLGVDGCPQGWFAVRLEENALRMPIDENDWRVKAYPNIVELWAEEGDCTLILIDIPIGLPNANRPTRNCDREARTQLCFPRRTSVFSPPGRDALNAETRENASDANWIEIGVGLSPYSWGIVPKIREVDDFLTLNEDARHIIRECHPELCFWGFSGGPVNPGKKTTEGRQRRMEILGHFVHPDLAEDIYNYAENKFLRRDVARDDIIDAMAAAFTALRGPNGIATLPNVANHEEDALGLPMEMVYPIQPV